MDSLVSTEWLEAELGAPDLRVIDATLFLPGTGRDARAEFEAAHIPGAVFFDIDEIADLDSPLPHMLPPEHKFASRMQSLGLGDGNRFVVYDNSPLHSAARAWWMLEDLRRPLCRVARRRPAEMEGGGPAARERAASRTGTAISPPCSTATRSPTRRRCSRLVGAAATRSSTRAPAARFAGEDAEPRPGLASGHIPGSRNLPQSEFFNADNSWKRGDDAARRVRRGGRRPRRSRW